MPGQYVLFFQEQNGLDLMQCFRIGISTLQDRQYIITSTMDQRYVVGYIEAVPHAHDLRSSISFVQHQRIWLHMRNGLAANFNIRHGWETCVMKFSKSN